MNSLELHRKDGIHVHVGASKADQENAELDVVLLPFGSTAATCAPCAAHRWVALVGIAQGEDASQRRRRTSTGLALGPRLLAKRS